MLQSRVMRYARMVARLASDRLAYTTRNAPIQYTHMGALLCDSILQSGLNYQTVVVPRVNTVLSRFPDAISTFSFLQVLIKHGANNVICWKHPEKPRRLVELTTFLVSNGVYTKIAISKWIDNDRNAASLMSVRGIGPKTIDYMRMLCGIDGIAVDRHIRKFSLRAGVPHLSYEEVREIVQTAADIVGVSRSCFDKAVWQYESNAVPSLRKNLA